MAAAVADRNVSSNQRPGPKELFLTLGTGNVYQRAAEEGVTVSSLLERENPSEQYPEGSPERQLDAFERLFVAAGIRTTSDFNGSYYASLVEDFAKDANTRALFPEWCARTYRRVSRQSRHQHGALSGQRNLLTSDKYGVNTYMRPYFDEAVQEFSKIQVVLPLSELLAASRPVRGDQVRTFRFSDTAAQRRMTRVVEGTELPRTSITGAERNIYLVKFGRAIDVTYEILRRQPIDEVAFLLARFAIQGENDKVARVLDVAVNGDGNSGTAGTVYNLTTLDNTTSANNLTLAAWLSFKLKFRNPYVLTHAIAQEAAILKTLLLNTGTANVPLAMISGGLGFGGFTQINPQLGDNVRIGLSDDAPSNRIVGFDARFALVEYTEIGSDISESQRWILNQTETMTMSENTGYRISDPAAIAVLRLDA